GRIDVEDDGLDIAVLVVFAELVDGRFGGKDFAVDIDDADAVADGEPVVGAAEGSGCRVDEGRAGDEEDQNNAAANEEPQPQSALWRVCIERRRWWSASEWC